jgi:bifunctional non-homologous end joining protein LigD
MADALKRYREKRDFAVTSEPKGGGKANERRRAFVIQKHWASRLHYDLRLELDGVMKSWAVPKGPSYDPSVKRMAVQVEDHPISYNQFEGVIPPGQYGAGKVIIWDEGAWTSLVDPHEGYRDGHLKFTLDGVKMRGQWALVRLKQQDSKQPTWLLIKDRDDYARPSDAFSVVDEMPDSVVPLRGRRQKAATGKSAAKPAGTSSAKAASANPKPAAKASAKSAAKSAAKSIAKSTAKSASKRAVKSAADKSAEPEPATLPGIGAALPDTLQPPLATLVDTLPPTPEDWLYEVKYDGYRILARVDRGHVRLYTRNGNDWTDRLPHLAKALGELKADAWVDGEIVVLGDNGAPNFQALQNAFESAHTGSIRFYAFDLPFIAGRDLRGEPLTVRRGLLEQFIAMGPGDPVFISATFDASPGELMASACRMGLEGIIAKRLGSSYESRRTRNWIKLKCGQRQEFVIVGYTDARGSRQGFGSLLLAVHGEDGELRYAGNVGTGFDDKMLVSLHKKMAALATDRSPLPSRTGITGRPHWLRPALVAEVSFGSWTDSSHIRHSVFRGLREDKPASAVSREQPVPAGSVREGAPGAATARTAALRKTANKTANKTASKTASKTTSKTSSGTANESTSKTSSGTTSKTAPGKLSHPERIIDPSTGLTKLDLARYYGLVAPLLLPHLVGRPLAFVRAPSGIEGQLFFQKHLESPMPGVMALPEKLYPGHAAMMEISTAPAIMSAAQMNVVEFHTWNAVKTAIDKPDRMLFDLDPGEGVKWPALQQGAQLMQTLLHELGLACWLKTSGGKGLHIVVPLRKQYDWETVRNFSEAIVRHLARTLPSLFVAKSGPRNRVGKIFVDYLRNGFGATTVAAWSARARPGLGISVPIAWPELPNVSGGAQWTIATAQTRLDVGNDPWGDYAPQTLANAMKILAFGGR